MTRIRIRFTGAVVLALMATSAAALAADLEPISLPMPDLAGGKPLLAALAARQTMREFSPAPLPLPALGELLWAAAGVNRQDSGKRTAPSAMNRQEIDVYVALEAGLYLYHPGAHRLDPVLAQDLRALTGTQDYIRSAPLQLIYVADYEKMGKMPDEVKEFYAATDTGFIAQNVYLDCASQGLATVVRGSGDKKALAAAMKLRPEQHVILSQTVAMPAK